MNHLLRKVWYKRHPLLYLLYKHPARTCPCFCCNSDRTYAAIWFIQKAELQVLFALKNHMFCGKVTREAVFNITPSGMNAKNKQKTVTF